MVKAHKHEWESWLNTDGEWKCKICGRMGKEVKRYNHKTGRDEYVIRANRSTK